MSYEWGAMGERKSIAYPDGRKFRYQYDGLLRLKGMQMERETGIKAGGFEEIRYRYDEAGRVSEKLFPDGMRTCWLYDERGLLKELVHKDSHGILDRYRYEYDPMGNKTAVTKERRGLSEGAGRYEYSYDALSRLSQVSRNGEMLRSYEYDSFSNRSCLRDFGKGKSCFYHYDVLNRLTAAEEQQGEAAVQKAYAYDGRGNLVREETDGNLFHGYEYGAMNRLTGAWDNKGKKAEYFYNGLGQRVGRTVSTGNDSGVNNAINAVSSVYSADGEEEDYILDLTRPYHNLLEIRKGSHCQSFFFDGGVAAMEEGGGGFASAAGSERRCLPGLHYYLHDELGSPVRVSGYRAESGSFAGISDYLTYGYDEFGNDLGKEPEETGIPNPYDRQGEGQPFGYTGYRYDGISGSYFAQAREYKPEAGRFTAEDVIKGNGAVPMTLNQYGYCWGNPLILVDNDGKNPLLLPLALLALLGTSALLGGCGKTLDEEDILPVPSATSDYVFKNSMETYNSKEYIKRTNCYAYALDIIDNPITEEPLLERSINGGYEKPWAIQPGMFINEYNALSYTRSLGTTDYSKNLFISHVKGDAEMIGLKVQEYREGMTGGYVIAIAVDSQHQDYHFYRENGDGTWSAKMGAKEVVTGIVNPQIDAYERRYKTFLGYFYVSEGEQCCNE